MKSILLGTFLACILTEDLGDLQTLPPAVYPLALCNDGTQANYHVQNYHQQGKIVINLQGGAYCDSIEDCTERCETTNLCTADKAPEYGNILSPLSLAEDPFKDYTQVRVHYCSSDTWSGTRAATDETGGFHFYGKYIFDAVAQDLALNFQLLEATHVVLAGGSAGAQGAALRCDDFNDWVKFNNPTIDVKCLLDSPEFYPPEVHTEDCANRDPGYQNYLSNFWERIEDETCLEFAEENALENVGELCGVTARFLQFVTTPLAMLTSHEDAVFTGAFGCQPYPNSPEHEQFRADWMAAHSDLVMDYISDFPDMSWFAPNCKTHVIMMHPQMSVIEEQTGELTDVFTFVSQWLNEDRVVYANDDVNTDNPTCN